MRAFITRYISVESLNSLRRYWLTLAFFFGFLIDNITLNRVDQLFDNLVLLTYVLVSMGSILVLYASIAKKLPRKWVEPARMYAPLFIQFSFGGLLSGMLIFYGRSGDWSVSWPFLLLIIAVIYGNETIRDRAGRLVFNLAIFFVGLFSYVILVVPVLTGLMGPWIFVGSGILALVIMRGFMTVLYRIIPNFLTLHMRTIIFTIGSIFVGFNFLYFTNIIPPIPLSLKDIGVYHNVERLDDGNYQLTYEKGRWWEFFKNSDEEFHSIDGQPVYCFAKVFAPTRLETEIFHHWQYFDEATNEWDSYYRLSYGIAGGRGSGFRGYTMIENYQEGTWRCTVETSRGQILGREEFSIDGEGEVKELVTRVE